MTTGSIILSERSQTQANGPGMIWCVGDPWRPFPGEGTASLWLPGCGRLLITVGTELMAMSHAFLGHRDVPVPDSGGSCTSKLVCQNAVPHGLLFHVGVRHCAAHGLLREHEQTGTWPGLTCSLLLLELYLVVIKRTKMVLFYDSCFISLPFVCWIHKFNY